MRFFDNHSFDSKSEQLAGTDAFTKATSLKDHAALLSDALKSENKHSSKKSSQSKLTRAPMPSQTKEAVYAQLDPLLAILYKDWRSAIKQYNGLKNQFGDEDVMVDVAIDTMDGARLSFETRLLEVKSDKELFAKAESLWDAGLKAQKGEPDLSMDPAPQPEIDLELAIDRQLQELQAKWYFFAMQNGLDTTDNVTQNFSFFLFIMRMARGTAFQYMSSLQDARPGYKRAG